MYRQNNATEQTRGYQTTAHRPNTIHHLSVNKILLEQRHSRESHRVHRAKTTCNLAFHKKFPDLWSSSEIQKYTAT